MTFTLIFAAIIWMVYVESRPNFIFILTDDQDITLESMQAMPNTLKYIANEGITFNNTFISTPICCPSRTETITGRNFHNIKHDGNNNCMHVAAEWNMFSNPNSMFQIFKSNDYITAAMGKIVNNQSKFWCNNEPNTAGFDRIHIPCKISDFYGTEWFDKYMNGTMDLYNLTLSENIYQTSYIGNASIKFINDRMMDKKPFIIWIGLHAPHCPATPASWYADRYSDSTAPNTPNYNESDPLKHGFVGTNPPIDSTSKPWIDQLFRDRLRSLLSVDDLVYDINNVLKQYDDNNSYIVYTSDHGYHLGQYDLPASEMQPYEETIRIPLYVKGPNVPKNIINHKSVGNIDILPTFLSLAGIKYNKNTYDGRTLTDISDMVYTSNPDANQWREVYLTQYQSVCTAKQPNGGFNHIQIWFPSNDGSVVPGQIKHPPNSNLNGQEWYLDDRSTNNWRALRIMNQSVNWMYAEFGNSSWNNASFNNPSCYEFYDINNDQFQRKNQYSSLSIMERQQLHSMLMAYGSCSGTSCW